MKKIAGLMFFIVLGVGGHAADAARDHGALGRVLSRYVKEDRVDYAGLKNHPEDLDAYLRAMAETPEPEFRAWPKARRLAWLINLYNAETLKLIIDHYPLTRIKDIGNFLKGPWDQPVVSYFGKTITLGDLEHQIIRKEYDDPRVHFALVCAARGCPPLRHEPFEGERLDDQLDDQGRRFLAQREKNRWENGVLYLSPIFDWFKEDFGNVPAFVAPFFPESERHNILDGNQKISYTPYDWTLNDIE